MTMELFGQEPSYSSIYTFGTLRNAELFLDVLSSFSNVFSRKLQSLRVFVYVQNPTPEIVQEIHNIYNITNSIESE